jgi:hypothetical protein
MRNRNWLIAVMAITAVLAMGLIAAGCGSSSDSTSTSSTAATTESSSTSADTSTTSSSGGATPDDVYNACIDAIKGTAAEAAGQSACEQARTAFEQCTTAAENSPAGSAQDTAVQLCQDAADAATQQLQQAGG